MRIGLIPLAAMACIIANCSAAKAEAPDPSNPIHCGVAFSVYHGIAKSIGDSSVAMLERRMTADATKAAGLPSSQRTRAEGEKLMKRLWADLDEAKKMVVACMNRQDAERRAS